jgi:hypothetical protein
VARHLDARIQGSGSIDAGLLTSATAAATIDGTGSVTVAAHDTVDATINGAEAGYGGVEIEVAQHADQLGRLLGIGIDYGVNDAYEWIPDGARYAGEQFAAHGIAAQVTSHDGGHGPIGPRALEVMFPFFARLLRSSV